MPKIDLDDKTYDHLTLLAQAWETSESGAVAQLLRRFRERTASQKAEEHLVPIHAVYKGVRCDGTWDRRTGRILIDEGPIAGQSFIAPSPAAAAMIEAVDPKVSTNRNGWSFWIVTDTGEPLQSIRNK